MLLCAAGLGLASLLGSTFGLLVKRIPHRWNDIFLVKFNLEVRRILIEKCAGS